MATALKRRKPFRPPGIDLAGIKGEVLTPEDAAVNSAAIRALKVCGGPEISDINLPQTPPYVSPTRV